MGVNRRPSLRDHLGEGAANAQGFSHQQSKFFRTRCVPERMGSIGWILPVARAATALTGDNMRDISAEQHHRCRRRSYSTAAAATRATTEQPTTVVYAD
jgi:hypothetical protein